MEWGKRLKGAIVFTLLFPPLFLGNIPENEQEMFYYANMRESTGALKGTIHKYERKRTSIGRIIPAEYYHYIIEAVYPIHVWLFSIFR